MFCFKCGAQLPCGAKYCMICGQHVPNLNSEHTICIEDTIGNEHINSIKSTTIPFIYDSISEVGKDNPYFYTFNNNFKGLASFKGEIIIPCVYEDIKPYFYTANHSFAYAEVKIGGLWGLHNGKREIISPIFSSLQRDAKYPLYYCMLGTQTKIVNYLEWYISQESYDKILFDHGKCFTYRNNKIGLYDYKNNLQIISCDYDKIEITENGGSAYKVFNEDKVGIYNTLLGKIIVPCIFDQIEICPTWKSDNFKVYLEGKVGVYTDKGLVVPCEYDDVLKAGTDSWGYKLILNGKCALTGNIFKKFPKFTYTDIEEIYSEEFIPGTYDYVFKISNGKLCGVYKTSITYYTHKWGKWPEASQSRYIDEPYLDFYELADIDFKYDSIEKIPNKKQMYKCSKNNLFGIINDKFEEILEFAYIKIELKDGYILLTKDDKVGIWNLLPCEYDDILTNCGNESFIILKSNGKEGIYHRYDHVFISNFEYDKVEYVEGGFVVWLASKCGLMSLLGQMLTEVIYDDIKYVNLKHPPFRFIVQINQKYTMRGLRSQMRFEYDYISYDDKTDIIRFIEGDRIVDITSEDFSKRYTEYLKSVHGTGSVNQFKI